MVSTSDDQPLMTSHPSPTLSRKTLTVVLISLVTVPFAFVISMVYFLKADPEPRIDAGIRIETTVWTPEDDRENDKTRLMTCMVVTNNSKDPWRNVTLGINKQFFYSSRRPLLPGESVTVPLSFIVTKGGTVPFRPATQKVKKVTVFAQIPSGDRGVFESEWTESSAN